MPRFGTSLNFRPAMTVQQELNSSNNKNNSNNNVAESDKVLNIYLTYDLQIQSELNISTHMYMYLPPKKCINYVHSTVINYNPKLKIIQIFLNNHVDKQIVTYS